MIQLDQKRDASLGSETQKESSKSTELSAFVGVFREQLKLHIVDDIAQRREKMPIIEFRVTNSTPPNKNGATKDELSNLSGG